jgi:hypothetical protein
VVEADRVRGARRHLTAPRSPLQGVEVVRLLVVLQGPIDAVAPRRDDGFIGDLGSGSGALGVHNWGSQRSWDHHSHNISSKLLFLFLYYNRAASYAHTSKQFLAGLRRTVSDCLCSE